MNYYAKKCKVKCKVKCKDCKLFYGSEHRVSMDFTHGISIDERGIRFPSNVLAVDFGTIKMCQHPSCFEMKEFLDGQRQVETGDGVVKNKVRVRGQAQLNADNDCKYYQKPKWKFWV